MPKFINHDDDLFDDNNAAYDPTPHDRQARRQRKRKQAHMPKKSEAEIIEALADETGLAAGFKTTYQPAKHEAGWLLQSLEMFYYQDLIVDVEALVKGGKEASVYRCTAHPSLGTRWVAAKVYRPRMFRQLRNDATYRQGRAALNADGKEINAKDWRTLKAMSKGSGSGYGQTLSHTSWLMYEHRTLSDLHQAGANVPQPIAVGDNAVLMTYFGDEHLPAPTLSEVQLPAAHVQRVFEAVLRNVEIMLRHGITHGDLSAFNILYWQDKPVFIDFPQVVDLQTNPDAQAILTRDLVRVCEYFATQGEAVDGESMAQDLWVAYGKAQQDPNELLVNLLEAPDYDAPDEA